MKFPKKHHILGLIWLGALPVVLIVIYFKTKHENFIFETGNKSVCYVYSSHVGKNRYNGEYYFYFYLKKYFGSYVVQNLPKTLNPIYKFYVVYYLKESPEESVVDYSKEIHLDSVFKYFPKGENPFEIEIKEDSLRRLQDY